jgi:hypothetical protein
MCYIFLQMAFPVFHEFDADGTIHTNGLHWEGFPRLAWEALSATGYLTPPSVMAFPIAECLSLYCHTRTTPTSST